MPSNKYQYFSVSLFYNLQYCILLSTTVEPLDLQKWYGRHPKMFDFWHIPKSLFKKLIYTNWKWYLARSISIKSIYLAMPHTWLSWIKRNMTPNVIVIYVSMLCIYMIDSSIYLVLNCSALFNFIKFHSAPHLLTGWAQHISIIKHY